MGKNGKKLKIFGKTATIAGVLLTGAGFYFWQTQEIGTKLFQLSNDLIGAGILIVVVGLLTYFRKWGG